MTLLRLGMGAAVGLMILSISLMRGDETTSPYRPIDQKLKSIVVSIDFTNATIDQAIKALADLSKQQDPERKGVGFIIQPEVPGSTKPITLKLDSVPVGVCLHYVCELAYARYKIDERMVSIVPFYGGGEGLVQRTFHVDPDFVKSVSNAGVMPTAKRL